MKQTIIVTGGAGFIASHVVDAYIEAGHKVVVIDNLATGFKRNLNQRAVFYKADIRDRALIERIFKEHRPSVVNHHAAIAEVVKSLIDPLPTFDVNVLGTANVLAAFGKYKTGSNCRFLFSSTGGAIYGEPDRIPATEKSPVIPLSPYGISKRLGEELIEFYARTNGFEYMIFRYPNVFGPRQNPKGEAGVVSIFCGLMLDGKRPMIFGDGTKSRDYVFVSDVVAANLSALTKGTNMIINLGSGRETTDKMIFDTLADVLGFRKMPIYKPFRSGEVYKIALSGRMAKRILNWRPAVSLRAGMEKVADSMR